MEEEKDEKITEDEEEVVVEIVDEVQEEKDEKIKKPHKSTSKVIIKELNNEIEKLKNENENTTDKLKRLAAEFDNYKKRNIRERDKMACMAESDIILAFIPIIDNLKRAIESSESNDDYESLSKGIRLVWKQLEQIMDQLGIEEMECKGKNFDPEKHEAVMHIEDDNYDENIIVEDLQKGYMYKDKVIKHSMVKVAN